jgi:hypothetical protein
MRRDQLLVLIKKYKLRCGAKNKPEFREVLKKFSDDPGKWTL